MNHKQIRATHPSSSPPREVRDQRERVGVTAAWTKRLRRKQCHPHGSRWSPIPLEGGYLLSDLFSLERSSTNSPTVFHPRSLSLSKDSFIEPLAVPCHPAKLFPSQGKSVTLGTGRGDRSHIHAPPPKNRAWAKPVTKASKILANLNSPKNTQNLAYTRNPIPTNHNKSKNPDYHKRKLRDNFDVDKAQGQTGDLFKRLGFLCVLFPHVARLPASRLQRIWTAGTNGVDRSI